MVYTICIKILRHVLESVNPPLTVVFHHLQPVVGGESPVLSVYREVVRRSSGLSVHVEIAALLPYITRTPTYSDRYISL